MLKKFISKLPKLTKRRAIILLIIIIGVGGYYFYSRSKKKNGFEASTVERGEVREELVLSGTILATEHAELNFETSGKLIYVGVKEGQEVNKGTLLGKLDSIALNSAYQQALANLRKYDANVQDVHDQVKDHAGDETFAQKNTRTTAEATKDSAYEAVIIAERNLKGASLYAPFDGIVTFVAHPFSGIFTSIAEKQFEVVNPETMYFKVGADQTEITQLHTGQEVEIVLDAFDEQTLTGKIERIDYAPDPNEVGVVYGIDVSLPKDSGLDYRLGMSGDATFVLNKKDDVLWVPAGFVNNDDEGSFVYLDHGKVKKYVEVGIEGEDRTQIIGDIPEGLTVYD